MKKNILLLSLLLLLSGARLQAMTDTTTCKWLSRVIYFDTWDTCKGAGYRNSISATILLMPGCYKYEWTVNGKLVGTASSVNYLLTKNGTYNFCLKVTDTCNKCDTMVCISKSFSCLPCNWKAKSPQVKVRDSCSGKIGPVAIYGSLSLQNAGCVKYAWLVNGKPAGNGLKMTYPVNSNGNYIVCLKITDTCNMCDTTICVTKTVSCKPSCNIWKAQNPFYIWDDSCISGDSGVFRAHIVRNFLCLKYEWHIDGKLVSTEGVFEKVLARGKHDICLKLRDTCNQCDTTLCISTTINCYNTCDWKARVPSLSVWDTCRGAGLRNSINGRISFKDGYDSCYTYTWYVNGVITGTDTVMNYVVKKNGSYNVCVQIYDTCGQCYTTVCSKITVSCFPVCNWKGAKPVFSVKDSCYDNHKGFIKASLSMNRSCLKYIWKVNGTVRTGNDSFFLFPVTKNAAFSICAVVIDNCNNCDTSFCMTTEVTCFKPECNFKERISLFIVADTCGPDEAIIFGYLAFNNESCLSYRWHHDTSELSDSSTMSYQVRKNGTYDICVTINDPCSHCDTTICMSRVIQCKALGYKSVGKDLKWLEAYPNPASDILNLEMKNDTEADFELINLLGCTELKGKLSQGNNMVNIAMLQDGVYILKISVPGETRMMRLIISR